MSKAVAPLERSGPGFKIPTRVTSLWGDSSWLAGRERQWILFACGLLYFAESFLAWAWPALDGYPAIERWLDPTFLTGDFYTNTTLGFGVDTWQAVVFGTMQRWTGVHYALQLAILGGLRHLLWPWVLYSFFKAIVRDETIALFGVVLGVLAEFSLPKTLGWSWLWGDSCPAMMAVFTMTIAWTEMLRKRAWSGFIILGLATIMQPLVGVHGGIFAAIIFFFDYSADDRVAALKNPLNYLGALVFLAIFAWQYLALSEVASARLPIEQYTQILVWERHPGDFLPSRFSLRTWIAFAIAAFALAIMLVKLWPRLPGRRLIVGGLAVYFAICLLGYIFVELKPIRLFVDLIPFRTVSLGAPLMLLILAAFATKQLREGRWAAAGIVAASLLAGPYAAHFGFPNAGAAILLLFATIIPAKADGAPLGNDAFKPIWRIAIPAILLLAIPIGLARRDDMILPTQTNQHPLYAWVDKNTAPDARFLVEQVSSDGRYSAAITPQLMRLVGRRAVVASFDYPFRDSNAKQWYKTWVEALGHGRPDRVETASAADLAAICKSLPYDYVVRRAPLQGAESQEVAHFSSTKGIAQLHVYKICG